MKWRTPAVCTIVAAAAALVVAYFALANRIEPPPSKKYVSYMDRSRPELAPYLWGTKTSTTLFQGEMRGEKPSDDTLITGFELLSVLRESDPRVIAYARSRLDAMLARRSKSGHWPHPRYDDFPDGWWSAMDYASIGLAAWAFYERTQEQSYREAFLQLVDRMISAPSEHGNMWRLASGACWLSEYSWEGQRIEEENYVLNGAPLALQTLRYAADLYPQRYEAAYRCVRDGIAEKRSKFSYTDGSWYYYMLRPKTENQAHYVIYETVQLDALHKMTDDPLFAQMANERRLTMKRLFIPYQVGDDLFFSRLGPPHPYVLDIYAISISVLDHRQTEIAAFKLTKGPFLLAPLPNGAKHIVVSSYSGDDTIKLFDVERLERIDSPNYPQLDPAIPEPALDAVAQDHTIMIEPERATYPDPDDYQNHQARITFRFSPLLQRKQTYMLGVEFRQEKSETMAAHVRGGNERSASRVLPKYAVGIDQIILLAPEGFRDIADTGSLIRSLGIAVDTRPEQPKRPFHVRGVRQFRNSYEVYRYIEERGADVTPLQH